MLGAAHPVALAIAWVISVYATTGTPAWALWRPLIVVGATVATAHLIVALLSRRPALAALATSAGAMFAAGLWQLGVLLAVPTVVWLADIAFSRWSFWRPWTFGSDVGRRASAATGAVSLAFLGLAVWQAATDGAFWDVPRVTGATAESQPGAPDIYVVMLDGYPRADVLSSRFGIDNSEFLGELQARGFDVAADSRSNYSITWMTLASVFQMEYPQQLPELSGIPQKGPEQYRVFGRLVNHSPALAELRSSGYQIASSPSAFSELDLVSADLAYPTVGRTWFETELVAESPLSDLFSGIVRAWASTERRLAVEVGLDRLSEVATRQDATSVFMFNHIFSPHPPFVDRADGSIRPLPPCYPSSCLLFESNPGRLGFSPEEYAAALEGQITHLNGQLLAAIDEAIQARPDAAIILFSDHGTRHSLRADAAEATRNFFAARTPQFPALFGEQLSTVNLLPTLLNAYLETDFPLHPFKAWVSYGYPLQLEAQ